LSDGAAALLVMSDTEAARRSIVPRARVVASAASALNPEIMGLGPVSAVPKVLRRAGLTLDDMDLIELNEAFASQVIACRDQLGLDDDRLNVFGGAIALGHPYAMTGARLIGVLMAGLEARGGRYGMATMCVGGGQGMAIVIENLRR
jgi:acetyl-CoA C-acetyltransferase